MTKVSFNYNIKVWLTTVLVTPLLIILADKIFSLEIIRHHLVGTEGFMYYGVIFGLIFSVPALILFSFSTWWLATTKLTTRQIKYILTALSVLLTFLTIYFTFNMDSDNIIISSFYSICISISIHSYRLEKKTITAAN